MENLPIFLINLDGSDDRLSTATAALAQQGSTFERLAAFDGRHLDPTKLPNYDFAKTKEVMGRALNGGEVGCFISHVEAAKRFLETDAPFGLVLEDDMRPTPHAMALVSKLIQRQTTPEWHVAHLAALNVKVSTLLAKIAVPAQSVGLHRAHYYPMRTTALLWSRAGAASFVESAYPICCPVDIHLRRWLQNTDMGVAVVPAIFSTTDAQSDIAATGRTKRSRHGRTFLYPVKRAMRVIKDKARAYMLKARAVAGRYK